MSILAPYGAWECPPLSLAKGLVCEVWFEGVDKRRKFRRSLVLSKEASVSIRSFLWSIMSFKIILYFPFCNFSIIAETIYQVRINSTSSAHRIIFSWSNNRTQAILRTHTLQKSHNTNSNWISNWIYRTVQYQTYHLRPLLVENGTVLLMCQSISSIAFCNRNGKYQRGWIISR